LLPILLSLSLLGDATRTNLLALRKQENNEEVGSVILQDAFEEKPRDDDGLPVRSTEYIIGFPPARSIPTRARSIPMMQSFPATRSLPAARSISAMQTLPAARSTTMMRAFPADEEYKDGRREDLAAAWTDWFPTPTERSFSAMRKLPMARSTPTTGTFPATRTFSTEEKYKDGRHEDPATPWTDWFPAMSTLLTARSTPTERSFCALRTLPTEEKYKDGRHEDPAPWTDWLRNLFPS
jgi:hypothetical protein